MKALGLTVGQLRAALVDAPDDMEVVVRASSDDDEWIVGGITGVHRDSGHDEDESGSNSEFIAIEVSDNPEAFEEQDNAVSVTDESITGQLMSDLFHTAADGDVVRAAAIALGLVVSEPEKRAAARIRCAIAINARRGAP